MRAFDIIIPNYITEKTRQIVLNCLNSLVKNTFNYRLIFIDNASPDKDGLAKCYEIINNNIQDKIIIENQANDGFVKAVNQGLKMSNAEYVVLLNNDTEVPKHWLFKLYKGFLGDKEENIGIVSAFTNTGESWQGVEHSQSTVGFPLPAFKHIKDYQEYNYFLENTYLGKKKIVNGMVAFFCAMIKKEVINKIGVLDEVFKVGFGDDDDYCHRARNAGYQIAIVLDTMIFHNHRTTFKALYTDDEIKNQQTENINIYKEKHGLIKK